jgi:hypothetical protein
MIHNFKSKQTYFLIPFSTVSKTKVEASLTYVLLEAPLIPEASLRLDLSESLSPGTDRYEPKGKINN